MKVKYEYMACVAADLLLLATCDAAILSLAASLIYYDSCSVSCYLFTQQTTVLLSRHTKSVAEALWVAVKYLARGTAGTND
jgi:hypothetical protein